MDFIRAGGFNMWVLLALAVPLVWTAINFARNADPQRLSLVRALTLAYVFCAITGFVSGLAATCHYVVGDPEALKAPLPILLQGFAESATNLMLGGGIAAIAWILVAVGVRRMPSA